MAGLPGNGHSPTPGPSPGCILKILENCNSDKTQGLQHERTENPRLRTDSAPGKHTRPLTRSSLSSCDERLCPVCWQLTPLPCSAGRSRLSTRWPPWTICTVLSSSSRAAPPTLAAEPAGSAPCARSERSSATCRVVTCKKGVLFTPVAVRFWRPGFCLLLNTLVSLNLRKISESTNSYLFDRPAVGPAALTEARGMRAKKIRDQVGAAFPC